MKIFSIIVGIGTCFFAIFCAILFILGISEAKFGTFGLGLIFTLNAIAIFANINIKKEMLNGC